MRAGSYRHEECTPGCTERQNTGGLGRASGCSRVVVLVADRNGATLTRTTALANIAGLPLAPRMPRLGSRIIAVGVLDRVGGAYADHAAQRGVPLPAEPTACLFQVFAPAGQAAMDSHFPPKVSLKRSCDVLKVWNRYRGMCASR